LTKDSAVLIPNTTYGAVKRAVHFVCSQVGAKIVYVDILPFLDDEEKLLEHVKSAITPNVTLALFDHIISETATILPVKKLIELLHSKGVKVIIDGAHSIGQIPINLSELAPDFYFSNLHKWLCASRGCAFLYVAKEHQKYVRPLSISHGYNYGYLNEFNFTGTGDYIPFISSLASFSFFEAYDANRIMSHNHLLAIQAGHLCANEWNTSLLCKDEV